MQRGASVFLNIKKCDVNFSKSYTVIKIIIHIAQRLHLKTRTRIYTHSASSVGTAVTATTSIPAMLPGIGADKSGFAEASPEGSTAWPGTGYSMRDFISPSVNPKNLVSEGSMNAPGILATF